MKEASLHIMNRFNSDKQVITVLESQFSPKVFCKQVMFEVLMHMGMTDQSSSWLPHLFSWRAERWRSTVLRCTGRDQLEGRGDNELGNKYTTTL